MSLIQALHCEIQPGKRVSVPALPSPPNLYSEDLGQQTESRRISLNGDPPPETGQPIFERVPSHGTTQARRLTVTVLLILANLVQVLP